MSVPCVTDTCSITATTDANGRLVLDTRLDAAGGLVCGSDANPNSGLRLNIVGEPAAVAAGSISDCDNLLGVTTDGFVFAQRPRYESGTVNAAKVDVPAGSTSAYSTDWSVTNNSACARLCIVTFVWNVQYTVTALGSDPYPDNAYRSDFVARAEVVGKISPSHEIDISGANALGGSDLRSREVSVTRWFTINASESVTIRTWGERGSSDYGLSMTGGSWNGLTGQAILLMTDLAPGNMF